jgi:hypothetical protein
MITTYTTRECDEGVANAHNIACQLGLDAAATALFPIIPETRARFFYHIFSRSEEKPIFCNCKNEEVMKASRKVGGGWAQKVENCGSIFLINLLTS